MKAIFVGGTLNGVEMDTEKIFETVWNGRFSPNWYKERQMGRLVPRAELDNQPLVDGYLNPMWDGGRLRYETQEMYNILSADY